MGHPAHTLLWGSLPHAWATVEGGSLFFFNEVEEAHLRRVREDDAAIRVVETGLEQWFSTWDNCPHPPRTLDNVRTRFLVVAPGGRQITAGI